MNASGVGYRSRLSLLIELSMTILTIGAFSTAGYYLKLRGHNIFRIGNQKLQGFVSKATSSNIKQRRRLGSLNQESIQEENDQGVDDENDDDDFVTLVATVDDDLLLGAGVDDDDLFVLAPGGNNKATPSPMTSEESSRAHEAANVHDDDAVYAISGYRRLRDTNENTRKANFAFMLEWATLTGAFFVLPFERRLRQHNELIAPVAQLEIKQEAEEPVSHSKCH